MSFEHTSRISRLPVDVARQIDSTCDQLESALKVGTSYCLEDYLGTVEEPFQPALCRQLLLLEWEYLRQRGGRVELGEYLARFPKHATLIRETAQEHQSVDSPVKPKALGISDFGHGNFAELATAEWEALGYAILGRLEHGGMGTVFLASQKTPERLVAVKVLRHGLEDEAGMRRFRCEVETLGRLRHPNIVPVFDVGQYRGRPFYSMEYCSEGSLADYLAQASLTTSEAATLLETLARAAHIAHHAGIVHRDLKPSNVLLQMDSSRLTPDTEDDTEDNGAGCHRNAVPFGTFIPKLADFGLAKEINQTVHTQTGAVLGTPQYMAPEQAQGNADQVGVAADIHGLGAILYECLTGQPPFLAPTVIETIRRVILEDAPPPTRLRRDLPADMATICLKCLRKEPSDRYRDAAALADDLRRFQDNQAIKARPVRITERGLKWARRHRAATALIVLLALCGTIGPIVAAWALKTRASAIAAGEIASASAKDAQRQTAWAIYARATAVGEVHGPEFATLLLGRSLRAAVHANDQQLERLVRAQLGAWQRDIRALRSTIEHQGDLRDVELSPDGKWIVTVGDDRTAIIWDWVTGRMLVPPLLHDGAIRDVAFSPDGTVVLTGSEDHTARLWETTTGEQIGPTFRHEDGILAVAFHPRGHMILTGSRDRTAKLWDAATGSLIGAPMDHDASVLSVSFSPSGSLIVTGSEDGIARTWDADAKKARGEPMRHVDAVLAACFSPDENMILTGSRFGRAQVWDAESGQPVAPAMHHHSWVNDVCFSPDGETVLTVSRDRTARFWEARTGEYRGSLQHDYRLEAGGFSQDGKFIVTGCGDGAVYVWDTRTPTRLKGRNPLIVAAFSEDGERVLASRGKLSAQTWDVADGHLLGSSDEFSDWKYVAAFSHDCRRMLVSDEDGKLRLCAPITGKSQEYDLRHPQFRVGTFSRDDRRLLTGGKDKSARIWNVATGELVCPPLQHLSAVTCVAFSPDGKTALTGTSRGALQLWDSNTGLQLGPQVRHRSGMMAAAFSPDGRTIASATFNGLTRFWDASSLERRGAPMRHNDTVWDLAFSSDGSMLLTGSGDNTARLWDVPTGLPLGAKIRHGGPVRLVAFSPDSDSFLTASLDGIARVWQSPRPVPGSPEQVLFQVQVATRMELDEEGASRMLDRVAWQKRREKLVQLQVDQDG